MSERKRGCGYRKIGALYLAGDPGIILICDGLPLPLEPCDCCGYVPPFSRNLQKIQPGYILQREHKKHGVAYSCKCPRTCPICYPFNGSFQQPHSFGLMFVGKKFYTPSSFIQEAEQLGISKRIPDVPKWLRLGETWVLLAHDEVPKVSLEQLKTNEMHMKEPEKMRAIFYAFKPQRIEMPVWKGQLSDDEILLLEKRGITPVLLNPTAENRKKHHGGAKGRTNLMRLLEPDQEVNR